MSRLPVAPTTDGGTDHPRPLRVALVGIGQELRGDDAAGVKVARSLLRRQRRRQKVDPAPDTPALLIVEGGPAPENCTGLTRRFQPDLVILVDSAHMEEPAGTIRWLDWKDITGLSASTHSLPLYMFAQYLTAECHCAVALIGIQPLHTNLGEPLSDAVRRAVRRTADTLSALLIS